MRTPITYFGGKQQLAEKQEETLAQLAATKSMLMSAKAQLEATKVTMTLAKGVLDPLVTQVTDLEKRQNELQIMREKALENLADNMTEGINGIVDRITGNTGSEEGEQGHERDTRNEIRHYVRNIGHGHDKTLKFLVQISYAQ